MSTDLPTKPRKLLAGKESTTQQADTPPFLTHLNAAQLGGGAVPLTYTAYGTGAGVKIYAVGERVQKGTIELVDRLSEDEFVSDSAEALRGSVCSAWQGTHVAALSAGLKYGVAKAAQVTSVAAKPGCRTTGPVSGLIGGLNWIIDHISGDLGPSVVSVSTKITLKQNDPLGVELVEEAVAKLIAMNVTVVSASSSLTADGCFYSPGRLPHVINVDATSIMNVSQGGASKIVALLWEQSNYGECIDIWAPGSLIKSASSPEVDATAVYSGVGQAAGLVAGAAALVLERTPKASPAQVRDFLISTALKDNMLYLRPRSADVQLQVPPRFPPSG